MDKWRLSYTERIYCVRLLQGINLYSVNSGRQLPLHYLAIECFDLGLPAGLRDNITSLANAMNELLN